MSLPADISRVLINAWREGVCQPFDELEVLSEADAYQVQDLVASALGWFPDDGANTWKLGGSPGQLISVARVPQQAIHVSGWTAPAGYCHRFGIESELVVRLGCDLDEYAELGVAHDAIDAWIPAIELCDTRFNNGEHAHPLLRLADQQLNRALILGEPVDSMGDWLLQRVELRVNGQRRTGAQGSHPFSDPLSSLPWLARHAAARGMPLKAGDLIATGSWTGLYWAPSDSLIEIIFDGVGSVSMTS
ncbi:fumarylacetoacetate hydrolase family protein [Pseudomonas oryzihabitans]|jgi:2-keto-4-pentenoate hydratase|uniref:2-keto-4-pentenoate hydratase n=1 Tax=Pseudomonas oryzihabitans TaxID=47885 RepID=A0A1G5PI27_9PSED|nr:fumarylacetoacetate hydrolase family protein [Pseudomonas psychrotolerans]NMY93142.1 hydratase [Pseudomonas psychrotolerans]SCZ48730.1 2-keto-4-pentenoate hydratase [Pseudomonas psychrotolerans]